MGNVTPITAKARAGITAPVPLTANHVTSAFSCGKVALDDWLKFRALKSEGRSSRTYVTNFGTAVIGYYCFAAGAVRIDEMPKNLRRNMPQIVPVVLIGRLAVDTGYQGLGVGKGLLKDALSRAMQVAEVIGARAVMVHAIDQEAAAFYAKFGFLVYPDGSQTFFLPMETIKASLP